MRINYVMWDIYCTGGIRGLLEACKKLEERGHDVSVTALTANQKTTTKLILPPQKNIVARTKNKIIKKATNNFFHPHSQMDLLRKIMPDADATVATLCLTASPVFRAAKGVGFYHLQHMESLVFSGLEQRIAEESYHLPLNKIVNSSWLQKQMKKLYGEAPSRVSHAIELDIFRTSDIEKKDDKEKRILCLGKSLEWKGLSDMFEAMGIISKERSDVRLVLYGNEPNIKSDVAFDYVSNPDDKRLVELYHSADVVVCPSWYESFPRPPLEAMACGTPVVTTCYGVEDYAEHEKNCLVVRPKEPEAMAEAVLKILENDNLRKKLIRNGLQTPKKFSWEKTAFQLEKIFEKGLA